MKEKKLFKHIKFAVLATDIALFTLKDGKLFVRLIKVNRPPYFKNVPGLPGGLIRPEETADEACLRLLEKRGLITSPSVYMEQLYTFSRVSRDPRGRVVSVAYFALVPWEQLSLSEQGSSEEAYWAPVGSVRNLAYDHDEMLVKALRRVRGRAMHSTLIAKLLPHEFTLTQLEKAYEGVLERPVDKRNFRKKILRLNVVKKVNRKITGLRQRPAQLFTFVSKEVELIGVFSK